MAKALVSFDGAKVTKEFIANSAKWSANADIRFRLELDFSGCTQEEIFAYAVADRVIAVQNKIRTFPEAYARELAARGTLRIDPKAIATSLDNAPQKAQATIESNLDKLDSAGRKALLARLLEAEEREAMTSARQAN